MRDSSLSACTQAVIAAEVGHLELAYDYFAEAALMDLDDLEHNTRDGLHIASLAGAWIVAVAGFGGMRDHDGTLDLRAAAAASDSPAWPSASAFAGGGCGSRSPTTRPATRSCRDRRSRSPTTARPITVTTDRPVTRPIPEIAAGELPRQPLGRRPRPRRTPGLRLAGPIGG